MPASSPITVNLHAGDLSGAAALGCDWRGHAETSAYYIPFDSGARIAAAFNLHCADVASLRALAAICTQAADALDAARAPVAEGA